MSKHEQDSTDSASQDWSAIIDMSDAPPGQKAEALVARGLSRGEAGDTSGALADFTAVIDMADDPADQKPRALFNRGVSKALAGDDTGAIADFTAIIDTPDVRADRRAKALVYRSICKGKAGDTPGAIADYITVIDMAGAPGGQKAQALLNRGVYKAQAGDTPGAITDFTAVIDISDAPVDPKIQALINRGLCKGRVGENAGGIADCAIVISMSDASADQRAQALANRGVCKGQAGDTLGAIADFTAVIDMPDVPVDQKAQALVNRGVCRGQAADTVGAIADFNAVIDMPDAPTDQKAKALVNRSMGKGHAGDSAGAIADCNTVISMPDTPANQKTQALVSRGVWKDQAGDISGAIADFTAVINVPDAPAHQKAEALFDRGVCKGQAGDTSRALADFTAVVDMPDAPADQKAQALVNRGVCKQQAGDDPGAIADCTTVIDMPDAPATPKAWAKCVLANSHWLAGNYSEAFDLLDQAATFAPNFPDRWRYMGLFLLELPGDQFGLAESRPRSVSCLYRYVVLDNTRTNRLSQRLSQQSFLELVEALGMRNSSPLLARRLLEGCLCACDPGLLHRHQGLLRRLDTETILPRALTEWLVTEECPLPSFERRKLQARVALLFGDPLEAQHLLDLDDADREALGRPDLQAEYYLVKAMHDCLDPEAGVELNRSVEDARKVLRNAATPPSARDWYYAAQLLYLYGDLAEAQVAFACAEDLLPARYMKFLCTLETVDPDRVQRDQDLALPDAAIAQLKEILTAELKVADRGQRTFLDFSELPEFDCGPAGLAVLETVLQQREIEDALCEVLSAEEVPDPDAYEKLFMQTRIAPRASGHRLLPQEAANVLEEFGNQVRAWGVVEKLGVRLEEASQLRIRQSIAVSRRVLLKDLQGMLLDQREDLHGEALVSHLATWILNHDLSATQARVPEVTALLVAQKRITVEEAVLLLNYAQAKYVVNALGAPLAVEKVTFGWKVAAAMGRLVTLVGFGWLAAAMAGHGLDFLDRLADAANVWSSRERRRNFPDFASFCRELANHLGAEDVRRLEVIVERSLGKPANT